MSSTAPVGGRGAAVTVVAQTAARAATIVVVLGSTAIVTRSLSIGTYTDWVTVLSLMPLSGLLLDPSLTPVVVRRLIQDPDGSPRPRSLVALRTALAAIAVGAVVGLTVLARGADAAPLAAVMSVQLLPRAFIITVSGYLQADQRLHRQTVLEAAAAALALAGLAVAAAADAPAGVLALAAYPAPTALLAIAMARELRRTPSARIPPPGDDRDRVRSLLHEALPLTGALVFVAIYTRIDVLFVNAAEATERAVAGYLFAFQFAEQVIVFGSIVASAALPLLAARGREGLLRDPAVHDLLLALTAAGLLATLGTIAIAVPFVAVVGGAGLAPAAQSLVLLAPHAAVMLCAVPLVSIYVAEGRGRAYLKFNLIGLAVNVAGNAALTLPLGVGAAARLTWGTELVVVVLASAPLWRGSPAGRRVAARLAGLMVVAVAASELAAAGHGNVVVAAVAALAVPALAYGALRRVVAAAVAR